MLLILLSGPQVNNRRGSGERKLEPVKHHPVSAELWHVAHAIHHNRSPLKLAVQRGDAQPCTPEHRNQKEKVIYNKDLCKRWHRIENAFASLKC